MTTSPLISFVVGILQFIGGVGYLARDLFRELFKGKFEFNLFMEQIYQIGTRSLPLIALTALCEGMVMTLQFGIGLSKFGGQPYVPKIVSLSILREMGPVFTSLMIAARVGAGIASEVGSMVVSQQVDAMRALGTSPIKKIVVPRVLACMLTLPILGTLANIIGVTGAAVVGHMELRLDSGFFIQKVFSTIHVADYYSGVGKTLVFAALISLLSCYYGLNVKEGAKEVGISTTRAVVMTSILILVGDFFLTKLFWVFETWNSLS
jgi:phospholipid/cholesterol/gamma-HCH transport system permease protein